MKNSVVIKGSQNGITMVLTDGLEFEKLKENIVEKLKSSAKFLGNADTTLSFEGRKLEDEEISEILKLIEENTELNIVYVILPQKPDSEEYLKKISENIQLSVKKKEEELEKEYQEKKKKDEEEAKEQYEKFKEETTIKLREEITEQLRKEEEERLANMPSMFYKGSLRSGQELEMETSVIVLGDVNPGASLSSKGNIVVIGTLYGNVHAGSDGNEDAFVVALNMQPTQIRIGSKIARSSENLQVINTKDKNVSNPKIAYVDDAGIYIETINRTLVKDLKV